MDVILKDQNQDRIALQHQYWTGDDMQYTAIVYDGQNESYNVLSRLGRDEVWSLLWRGTFKGCLDWVSGLLISLEADFGHLKMGVKYTFNSERCIWERELDLIVSHPFTPSTSGDGSCDVCDVPEKGHQYVQEMR